MTNPTLYQINIRVFRHRFGAGTRLLDIPVAYWEQLAARGIDYVWLMGVWQTGRNARGYGLAPELYGDYGSALPDWQPNDVIGSPYAIDRYVLHEDLGKPSDMYRSNCDFNRCFSGSPNVSLARSACASS